jgi:hypothetical protein
MSVSEAFSTFMKIRRIVVIVSIIAGATGYKTAPMIWHKAQGATQAKTEIKAPTASGVTTNSDGIKLSNCDLGAVSLTNHYETCVSIGPGKDCRLTPNLIDKDNVQLTLAVESKNAKGKIHDLSITQVVRPLGKSFDVAVGDFSFSLTPNMTSE